MEQLCFEVGFPAQNFSSCILFAMFLSHIGILPELTTKDISGEQPDMLIAYPELKHYRNVIFLFKFMLAPSVGITSA